MKIYLSPSNQLQNTYVVGNTTEKVQMEKVAARVKEIIAARYNAEVMMATLSMGIGLSQRPTEAKSKGADLYLAIHSNASEDHKATGTVAYFNPKEKLTESLAEHLVSELNFACPIKSNRINAVSSGMVPFDGKDLGEIRSPWLRVAIYFATLFNMSKEEKDGVRENLMIAFPGSQKVAVDTDGRC